MGSKLTFTEELHNKPIQGWLLEGDVSIQYQVKRDLLNKNDIKIQERISTEGWGRYFLSKRKPEGHWGDRFYQPKWISTHYTLLDLRNMNLPQENSIVQDSITRVLDAGKALDGGIPLGPSTSHHSDVCVNAMFLNYASYFRIAENRLYSIVDSILNEKMPDGGFNCRTIRSGAYHSSLHTTISVLEGLYEFTKTGSGYRKEEVLSSIQSGMEFLLIHRLFLSDRTGEIIHKDFLRLSYPSRWKYDILRALDFFQYGSFPWDDRLSEALEVIQRKRSKNGAWNMQAAHPGQVHLVMEKAGSPSRWNTLRALRVLKHFK